MLVGCAGARARSAPVALPSQPFLLTFWCGPPLAQFDDTRAAEVAAAGFTVVGAPCDGGFDSALTRQALDVAQRHGLRMWIADHRVSPQSVTTPEWPALLDAAVAEYRDHAALDGYVVADEPPAQEFDAVAAVVYALRAADPARLGYINLLPDYVPPRLLGAPSYEDYIEQFITTAHPQLLSYDYYPFGEEKDRSTFFTNLAVVRAAAQRHALPFMLIVLAMPHGPYRDPTEAELAWQVHHALAYGARGVSYFTYWTPHRDDDWHFRHGLIEDGRPTLRYFQVARINHELRTLAAALDGFDSIAVADSLGEIGVPFPIGPIDGIDGGPITAGLFGDDAGRLAVLLVNRDYRYGLTARLRLHPGSVPPDILDASTNRWQSLTDPAIVLPPGGARLLCWDGRSAGNEASARCAHR